ncbi:hypothetical protein [Agromyces salentinus]|nr:hypothetical protein [Agromyces salentinus]
MLDLIHVAAVLAVFVVIGLIAKGVERLGPQPRSSTSREASRGEDRA